MLLHGIGGFRALLENCKRCSVGPLLQRLAPLRSRWPEVIAPTLLRREAARHLRFGVVDKLLAEGEDLPTARRACDKARAARAERDCSD